MHQTAVYVPVRADRPRAHMVVDGAMTPTLFLGSRADPCLQFSTSDPDAVGYLTTLADEALALAQMLRRREPSDR